MNLNKKKAQCSSALHMSAIKSCMHKFPLASATWGDARPVIF